MKSMLFSWVAVLVFGTSFSQQTNQVVIGTIDSIQSTVLNEKRKVWVYTPTKRQEGPRQQQRYPVVYLLDGDAHFYSVVGMIQQLSQVNGNTLCPEMIVVGITNTDRTRDLTPTHVDADPPFMDSSFSKTSGGGERFAAFLEKELIPHIDATYPTQPFKLLIGHSFGGLTVMNIIANHTKLFNAYICIDPSMWWDKMKFLDNTKKAMTENKFSGKSLYLGIANTMEPGMTFASVQNDKSPASQHIRSIIELDNYLKAQKTNGLHYASKFYVDDDHGSAPLITTYDALRFIFSNYRFNVAFKDIADSTIDLAGKLQKHYEGVTKQFGYKVTPPEELVNGLGYELMNQKQFIKAGKLFQMNVDNYPESSNVYDSYADYCLALGEKEKAIQYYKKALTIKEVPHTREKLNNLLK